MTQDQLDRQPSRAAPERARHRLRWLACAASALLASCGSGSGAGGSGGSPTPVLTPGETVPACTALDRPGADPTLPYYRIRIEYTSTSDWSGLTIVDPGQVIKSRVLSTVGKPTSAVAAADHLGLNQPLQTATTVGITADYALRTDAAAAPFVLQLGKGVAGKVTVRVSSVVGSTVSPLGELDGAAGPTQLSVDLSALRATAPWKAPMAPVTRMAWAVFYPWYSHTSWTSSELRDHPARLYDSSNAQDMAWEIDQAQRAGIDGFLVSWWGPGSGTDKLMPTLLDVAEAKGFKIGIFLETLQDGKPLGATTLASWLSTYVSTYRDRPALMKVNGKPLVMPYVTCEVPVATWKTVVDSLHAGGNDATMVADCEDLSYLAVFDGAKGTSRDGGRAVRYYSVLSDDPTPKIWVGNAQPGYDDRLLPDRPGTVIDRQGGDRFRNQLGQAMLSDPQWMRIETWNEYWENTYVEPSASFGDLYVRIASEFLTPWKCPQ